LYPSLQIRKSKSLSAYGELTKPRIVLLLDFTAVMAFLVAASTINIVRLVAVIVAGTLASGGAGALNCYLDRDLDRTMGRTSRRPIPQGEVSPVHALVFGSHPIRGRNCHIRAATTVARKCLHPSRCRHLRHLLHQIPETQNVPEHCPRRISWKLCASRRLGRGDRTVIGRYTPVDGPPSFCLDP